MKILTSSDKKKIVEQLEKQFGITELPYLLIKFGEERLRIYSGTLSKEEISILDQDLRIETIGLYFAKIEKDGIRLTLDGIQILKDQIKKNVIELTDADSEKWLRGNDLEIKSVRGYVILKNNNEFLGCGKSTGEKITNFVPKERRIK